MKIRKYDGENEREAMLKVKEELGSEALIVSVKNVRPKGIFRFFKKPYVEVTAAVDDRSILEEDSERQPVIPRKPSEAIDDRELTMDRNIDDDYLEQFKSFVNNLPEPSGSEAIDKDGGHMAAAQLDEDSIDVENAVLIKAVYDQLLENEVREDVINDLVQGLGQIEGQRDDEVTDIISVVYKRIVNRLSDFEAIREGGPKNVFFVGPTGVGKTTTIAKVASFYTLNKGKKVALITSDTYRIAAVEQLRTYANILNIPIKVVYSEDELVQGIQDFGDMDLILIDTAGRSHKNSERRQDLVRLLEQVDDREVYLVLSVATKYKDLLQITRIYDDITKYKIIFTKLDETSSYGNILNIKEETGAKLSYVTFGQNVPDDISEVNPHIIARQVLGGEE